MGYYSDFLFARPSFAEGLARLVDVGGALNRYNVSPTGQEADALAMWADWSAVGADLAGAAEQFKAKALTRAKGVEAK